MGRHDLQVSHMNTQGNTGQKVPTYSGNWENIYLVIVNMLQFVGMCVECKSRNTDTRILQQEDIIGKFTCKPYNKKK